MLRKLIAKYSKNILTPALTSLFLLLLACMEAPKGFDYSVSFVSEGLVLLLIYQLAIREQKKTKIELEDKERTLSQTIDSEISNVTDLISAFSEENVEAKEHASKMLGDLMAQKAEIIQKKLKKQKDDIEAAQIKYDSSVKDMNEAAADIEKTLDDAVKAHTDNLK